MNMKRSRGFTLIELMITIVVAAVLLAIAVPSFRTLMANNRATTQANALFSALNYARSEAIGRRTRVVVCPNATTSLDLPTLTCGGVGDWKNGWLVFEDGGATALSYDGGDTLLKILEPLPGDAVITTTVANIGFDGYGTKTTSGEATLQMSEVDTSGDADRCVRISAIGMVRVHKVTGAATCP